MKKADREYTSKKVILYTIYFIYTIFLSNLVFELFSDYMCRTMPSFGDPGREVKLSLLLNITYLGVLVLVVCMIIIPLVVFTIKSIRNKKRALQILVLWGCAISACFIGLAFCISGVGLFGKIPSILGDLLLSFT